MAKEERLLDTGDDRAQEAQRSFIDVFAGCGGLSLGLMQAGWQGRFAVEKDAFAFETLKKNLIEGTERPKFAWPAWLPATPNSAANFLTTHKKRIKGLVGKVDLLAGGPPCQGFSSAGRRLASDPRNALMQDYLALVRLIQPTAVLVENVHGITVDFVDKQNADLKTNYAALLVGELSKEYICYTRLIKVSEFGVPQARTRFFLLAIRKDAARRAVNPFSLLDRHRQQFLLSKGLVSPVGSASAISDLEVKRNGVEASPDSPGFDCISYAKPRTAYQRLMQAGLSGVLADTRLARHRPHIAQRFAEIIDLCRAEGRLNTALGKDLRERFALKKLALRVLDPELPSPTITSMPDDLLHYREPRTLTVRENARLQSFPDWFRFQGKYTTGGNLRKKEVPRFTQVANAVPPLMAEALGNVVGEWLRLSCANQNLTSTKTAMF